MNLLLLDTGYIANSDITAQTQLSDDNRAGYTGAAVSSFTLKVQNLSLSGSVSTENKPVINSLTDIDTTLVSVSNRMISVAAILHKRIVTDGYSTNNIVQLLRYERTLGLKLLYPSANTDLNKTIIEAYGAVNTNGIFAHASPSADNGTVSTTTPYLVGRVKNITITDNETGDYWRVTFQFEISE